MFDKPKPTKKRHWEWWIGILLGVVLSYWNVKLSTIISFLGDLFLWFVILVQVYASLKMFRDHQFAPWPHREKRKPNEQLWSTVGFYLLISAILLGQMLTGSIPAARMGVKSLIDPVICFAAGFLGNVLFQAVYMLAFPLLSRFSFLDSTNSNYRAFRMLLPRQRCKKYLLIVIMILCNPIYEEVLYRGYLVHHLGLMIDNMALSAFIGYIIFIIMHLYQGPSLVFIQTLNYLFFVGFLLSPWGLIGVIGFHFGGDLIPFLRMKPIIQRYRENVRKARKRSLDRGATSPQTLPETT